MSFHAARSRTLMPRVEAMWYSVSPRFTTVVAPCFGLEGWMDAVVSGSRMTWLEQPAMTTVASAAAMQAAAVDVPLLRSLMLLLPRELRLPHQPPHQRRQQHRRRPADRFDVATQHLFGTRTEQAHRQGNEEHTLAAADQHAQHVLEHR